MVHVHNHLGRWLASDGDWLVTDVPELLDVMDSCGVETIVNLDGRWGEELTANLDRYDRAHPGRFITFAHFDWTTLALPEPDDVTAALLTQLDHAVSRGARGLKHVVGTAGRGHPGHHVHRSSCRVLRRGSRLGGPDAERVSALQRRHRSRIGELGRVPRRFRRLVAAHPRRVLFGTDSYPPCAEAYEVAFRCLETDDEAFGYAPGCGGSTGEIPPHGRWDISAAALPPDLLLLPNPATAPPHEPAVIM